MISKLFILLSATAIWLTASGTISAQGSGCGTVVPQTQVDYELEQRAAGRDRSLTKAALEAAIVPLTIHVVRSSAGTGGLTPSALSLAMIDLNAMWTPMDVTFYICGDVHYIDADSFFDDMSTSDQRNLIRQIFNVSGTINIYFVPSSSGFPYCGLSSFSSSSVQGILMNNNCVGTYNPSTFAHEIGHYFDLYHTHETAFGVECPDRTNCYETGDLHCDTPADPTLYLDLTYHVSSYPGCAYDDSFSTPEGCFGSYAPQTENLMSYSQKRCRYYFSPEQVAWALSTLNYERSDLLSGCMPVIDYVGRSVAEASGDGDGLLEPGESIELDVTITNIGSQATGTAGLLTTTDPYLTVTTGLALFDATIFSGLESSTQTPFVLEVSPGCPDPHVALLDLAITADNGYAVDKQFYLFIGTVPGFADDMESGIGNWSHYAESDGATDDWHIESYRSHTGSYSWKMGGSGPSDYADGSDAALVTPPFLLPEGDLLSFWHWIDAELDAGTTAWDGGIVMISDGEGIWEMVEPVGGYPYTIASYSSSPFGGNVPCFSGSHDWTEVTLDLSTYSGIVQLMFRFGSDGSVTEEGWYIDDLAFVPGGCCEGRVGDANASGEDEPSIGDVAELIDHLFIDKPELVCVAEADINQSGGVDPSQEEPGSDITIGDVADLVNYLFIATPELGLLPDCL